MTTAELLEEVGGCAALIDLDEKNDLLCFFCRVRAKTPFPLKCPVFDGLHVMIQNISGDVSISNDMK